jgi:hypothetical protein
MAEQHGRDKEAEADDPYELNGINAPGDKRFMARTLVEEFARLGMDEERLMEIFKNDFYQSAHNLYLDLGAEQIESIIEEVLDHREDYCIEIEYTHENMDTSSTPFPANGEARTDE